MDATPLPTIATLTAWQGVAEAAQILAEKLAAPAWDLRQAVSGIYTTAPIGVYLDLAGTHAAICDEFSAPDRDLALIKSAVARWDAGVSLLSPVEAADPVWIKVAYSPGIPLLHRAGEALNFFRGTYPGGIPNHPSPLTGMLTSGLVGAGLGYGAGWLGEQMMPDKWRKGRLSKTLAALGAMPGLAAGATWGLSNKMRGLPFNDNSLLNQSYGDLPTLGKGYTDAADHYGAQMKQAAEDSGLDLPMSAINVDALGRTLWETGASPQVAGTTQAVLQAAQRMPGGTAPGWVTPWQMANLATHMGAGYISGALVGQALGLLTGAPASTQNLLKQTGLYTGVVRAVLPSLFGAND